MANVVRWYDFSTGTARLVDSATIGSLTTGTGLTFDGNLYWLADDAGSDTISGHIYDGGSFREVCSYSLGSIWTQPAGLVSDGNSLILACRELDSGPPAVEYPTLVKVDKGSGAVSQIIRYPTIAGNPTDLGWDGQNILRIGAIDGATGRIQVVDTPTGERMFNAPDTTRNCNAGCYVGSGIVLLIVQIGSNRFLILYDLETSSVLKLLGNIGVVGVKTCCMVGQATEEYEGLEASNSMLIAVLEVT